MKLENLLKTGEERSPLRSSLQTEYFKLTNSSKLLGGPWKYSQIPCHCYLEQRTQIHRVYQSLPSQHRKTSNIGPFSVNIWSNIFILREYNSLSRPIMVWYKWKLKNFLEFDDSTHTILRYWKFVEQRREKLKEK